MELTGSFRRYLTITDGNQCIELMDCDALQPEGLSANDFIISKSIFLENLVARVWLPSFLKAPFPDLLPEMSVGEKYEALLNIEDSYPYLGIQFYVRKGDGIWEMTGITARPNNKGRETLLPLLQPYITPNLVKLFAPNEKLGVQLIDYGHGLLKEGDIIQIEGEYRVVIDVVRKPQSTIINEPPSNFSSTIGTTKTLVRNSNTKRAFLYLQNAGNARVWFNFNQQNTAINQGLFLDPGGSFWMDPTQTTSEIWAISETGTNTLTGIEGSYL